FQAKIANSEQTAAEQAFTFFQQSIRRDYLDLDEFRARRMNVEVTRENGFFQFQFTLHNEGGEEVVLRLRGAITAQELEDQLVEVRRILENLVLHSYMDTVVGSTYQFLEAVQKLAGFGRDLWLGGFFRKKPNSELDQIGQALRDRPLEDDAIIQVSMPGET